MFSNTLRSRFRKNVYMNSNVNRFLYFFFINYPKVFHNPRLKKCVFTTYTRSYPHCPQNVKILTWFYTIEAKAFFCAIYTKGYYICVVVSINVIM